MLYFYYVESLLYLIFKYNFIHIAMKKEYKDKLRQLMCPKKTRDYAFHS